MDDSGDIAGMIRDSAAAFVSASDARGRARAVYQSEKIVNFSAWADMAGNGWTGMLAPENARLGLSLREAAALHVELGRGLVPEPLIFCAHLPLLIASACGPAGAQIAAAVAAGAPVAVAWQGRPGALSSEITAVKAEKGRLSGEATTVIGADFAEFLFVSARSDAGIDLYRVAANEPGLRRAPRRLADGASVSDLTFDCIPAERLTAGRGAGILDEALDQARVLVSAELLGVMRATFDMTLDYLRTRGQFGRAIGAFQAIQHRAVDLYVDIELTEAALDLALDQFEASGDPLRRAAAASAVKARASQAAMRVGREAVQLHGAIAYALEHDACLHLGRALTLSALLGDACAHRRRYGALIAPLPAA